MPHTPSPLENLATKWLATLMVFAIMFFIWPYFVYEWIDTLIYRQVKQ